MMCSLNVAAMGLGELKVYSSLNQPFEAEIELLDVGNIPLSEIRANLSPVEEYQQLGLERDYEFDDLAFLVERNKHGRPVIKIHSVNRISSPFAPLVVDLAWSGGQVYRAYTVLLDPPNYQLVKHPRKQAVESSKFEGTHTESHADTGANANVNTNVNEIHETASTEKAPITSAAKGGWHYESQIPAVPMVHAPGDTGNYYIPHIKTFLSAVQDVAPSAKSSTHSHVETTPELKAQMALAVSAIASVRESNDLLKEQLKELRAQNQKLQERLKQRDEAMNQLQKQLKLLLTRQGIQGQVIQMPKSNNSLQWLWLTLILGILTVGSILLWRRWGPPERWSMNKLFARLYPSRTSESELNVSDVDTSAKPVEVPPVISAKEATITPMIFSASNEEPPSVTESKIESPSSITETSLSTENQPLEIIKPKPNIISEPISASASSQEQKEAMDTAAQEKLLILESNASSAAPQSKESEQDNHVIEFTLPSVDKDAESLPIKPIKSKAAIETLFSLAKTYMDMKDPDAARQTLLEVLKDGDAMQQSQAQDLLKQLDESAKE